MCRLNGTRVPYLSRIKGHQLLAAVSAIAIVALAVTLYPQLFRHRSLKAVRDIVTAQTSNQAKIDALKQYVAIGDSFSDVSRRLGYPTSNRYPTRRPANHQIGTLVLAIRTDGVVTGIGTALPGSEQRWIILPEKWWDKDTPLQPDVL